jgi:hypothetical protein
MRFGPELRRSLRRMRSGSELRRSLRRWMRSLRRCPQLRCPGLRRLRRLCPDVLRRCRHGLCHPGRCLQLRLCVALRHDRRELQPGSGKRSGTAGRADHGRRQEGLSRISDSLRIQVVSATWFDQTARVCFASARQTLFLCAGDDHRGESGVIEPVGCVAGYDLTGIGGRSGLGIDQTRYSEPGRIAL